MDDIPQGRTVRKASKREPGHIPFRPSNADHGYWFEQQWCEKCQRERSYRESGGERGGCRILTLTNAFNEHDPEYPKEWRQDGPDGPRCTAFEPERERKPRVSKPPRQRATDAVRDLFS